MKLIALVCPMSLASNYVVVYLKEELKTENGLSTFVVVGVVNTEIFINFMKLGAEFFIRWWESAEE